MINRNEVAKEKMARAAELLQQNHVDMWAIYTRLKNDTALELLFNTSTQNEVLFLLTKEGDRIAIACPEDAAQYLAS